MELVCRVVVMLIRIHHSQLTATSSARATLSSLHPVIHAGVQVGYHSQSPESIDSVLSASTLVR